MHNFNVFFSTQLVQVHAEHALHLVEGQDKKVSTNALGHRFLKLSGVPAHARCVLAILS